MKTLKTKWTGIRPLIMANPQTVQLSNKYAVESRRVSKMVKDARKKMDENKLAELEGVMSRNDWEASAYWDGKNFYFPDTVVLACIRAGATAARKGKDIERGMLISETETIIVPPEGKSHNSLDAYYKDDSFRLSGPCKIPPKTGSLVWKTRCMIPTGWNIQFTVEFSDDMLTEKNVITAMETAGTLSGIGGWRPTFGRFIVEIL